MPERPEPRRALFPRDSTCLLNPARLHTRHVGGSSDAPKPLCQGRTPTWASPQQPTAIARPATVRGWGRTLTCWKGSMCTDDKNQISKLIKKSLELHNLTVSTLFFFLFVYLAILFLCRAHVVTLCISVVCTPAVTALLGELNSPVASTRQMWINNVCFVKTSTGINNIN